MESIPLAPRHVLHFKTVYNNNQEYRKHDRGIRIIIIIIIIISSI